MNSACRPQDGVKRILIKIPTKNASSIMHFLLYGILMDSLLLTAPRSARRWDGQHRSATRSSQIHFHSSFRTSRCYAQLPLLYYVFFHIIKQLSLLSVFKKSCPHWNPAISPPPFNSGKIKRSKNWKKKIFDFFILIAEFINYYLYIN